MTYLDELNAEQKKAATTINGPVLIIAGAGSGKTKTLVSRVAYMLDNGINSENILLLTFTNKAAKEMKERIGKSVGQKAKDVTACTFHSFFANFLRYNCKIVGISNKFNILDSPDAMEALSIAKELYLEEMGWKDYAQDFPSKRLIMNAYSESVNSCISVREAVEKNFDKVFWNDIERIITIYKKYKKERSLLDYDDILMYSCMILEDEESIRKGLQAKYKYISCDEYQDTNIIQDKILRLMCPQQNPNICVVGDDNQSIYKFRFAEVDNIFTFEKRYPGTQKIILNQNYRSSQEILNFSNTIMEHATEGIKKNMIGQFSGPKPELVRTPSNQEEVDFIINRVLSAYRSGTPLKEMAVIIRYSRQSFLLEKSLTMLGIKFKKFGGEKFMEKEVVKDILSFLRIAVNNGDEIALYRILKRYPGIGKKYAKEIADTATEFGLNQVLKLYPKRSFNKYLQEFVSKIDEINEVEIQDQLSLLIKDYYPSLIDMTINASKSKDKNEYRKKLTEQLEESEILFEMAEDYKSSKKFLEDLILDATEPSDDEDYLNITTIHSAKGLEYDIVFIMDLINGIIPKDNLPPDNIPEELRCLYVAATRARKQMYLMFPQAFLGAGENIYSTKISSFCQYDDVLKTLSISFYK